MKVLKFFTTTIALALVLINGETFGATASNATQTVAGGGVTAKVTFLNPKSTDDPRFQVMLDTHSVNLDTYDLKTVTVMRDDTGKSYVPTVIENKGGGHHRETVVTFSKLSPGTRRVELIIKDIAGVKERMFTWNLE